MMETEHIFIGGAVSVIIAITIAVTACNIHGDATIERMVKAGADPIAARCAITGINTDNRSTCEKVIAAVHSAEK